MKPVLPVICIIIVTLLNCSCVNAYSETVKLEGGEVVSRGLNLNEGDTVTGRITIVGKTIRFYITDPNHSSLLSQNISNPTNFDFIAAEAGTYNLNFENLFPEQVTITFNYNVQRYILGFPQEYIILFAIVGLGLLAIVIFVALSPRP